MANYAKLAEVKAYAYQGITADESVLTAIIARASRLFDTAANKASDYFAAGDAGQIASARSYWGDGYDYLQVDPYLVATAPIVTMSSDWTVPNYIEVNDGSQSTLNTPGEFFLVRTYGDNGDRFGSRSRRLTTWPYVLTNTTGFTGWPNGIKVTVTAKWGWTAIPEDVVEAVCEMVINIWRTKDQAFARAVGLDGQIIISDPLTPRAKMIAQSYVTSKRLAFA